MSYLQGKRSLSLPDASQKSSPENLRYGDALTRLTPFGWSGGLIFIVGLLVCSFVLVGYFLIYWRNADMDFMVIYRSLSLADGRYVFYEHPAYFTIVSVHYWLMLLNKVGAIGVSALSQVPSALNVSAFDAAMTDVVRAGRLLSLTTALAFVLVFACLAKGLVSDWRIALLGTFAFAFSGGLSVHLRILRSEMISGCLFFFALATLILIAKRATPWRPLGVGLAALLCVLALENKIHSVLLIGTLPFVILPFGTLPTGENAFWRNRAVSWLAVLALALIAAAALYAALPLLKIGFNPNETGISALRPIFGAFGVYQIVLMAMIIVCMAIYSWIWRVYTSEFFAAVFALFGGASIGLLALYIEFHAGTVAIVLNPLEEMIKFADPTAVSATTGGGLLATAELLLSGVLSVLRRYTFFLFTSPRPTVFLTWLILPGIVYAWRRGERQVAIQATFLMLAAIGVDALGVRRGLKAEYFILTDPMIILAGMLLLDRMRYLASWRWAYPIGAALIVLHVGVSQAEPVKLALKRSGPEGICDWNQHYLPTLPLPWCQLPVRK